MKGMVVVIGITLYLTFCAFLILPHLGAPPIFVRMAIGLCASEFVAAVGWGYAPARSATTPATAPR